MTLIPSWITGKQERHLDESSSETACREVEEETGLDIKKKIDVNNYLVKASSHIQTDVLHSGECWQILHEALYCPSR